MKTEKTIEPAISTSNFFTGPGSALVLSLRRIGLIIVLVLCCNHYYGRAATITSTAAGGNWNSTSAWVGGVIPSAADIVIIAPSANINTNGNRICAGIVIYGTLTMYNNNFLTVNGDVSGNGTWVTGNTTRTISLTGNWTFNGTSAGNGATVEFRGNNNQTLSGKITTGTGTITIDKSGNSVTLGSAISIGRFILTNGTFDAAAYLLTASTPTLISGTLRVGLPSWSSNYSFTPSPLAGFTIEYYNDNPVINSAIAYQNLVFSGNSTAGANGTITLQGNLTTTNGGILNFGSNNVILSGTVEAISVAGFTTTGTVIMAKTGGTAALSGNLNGNSLVVNGTGGTLDLGDGLIHTFTGDWTRTAGTINGRSGLLRVGGTVSGTGGTFIPGNGTVEYYDGVQTVAGITYNNLTLSGSGIKTSAGITVNGTLSMEGSATYAGSAPVYGPAASLQYKGSEVQTTGAEFPSTFAGTGGIIINNPNGVNLGGPVAVSTVLTLTNGKLILGANNLTLTPDASVITPSGSSYIVADGQGFLMKQFNPGATDAYLLPVGDAGSYSPASLTFTANSVLRTIGVKVTDGVLGTSGSDYISRYWTFTDNAAGTYTYDASFTYAAGDLTGSHSNLLVSRWDGTEWTQYVTAGTSPTITMSGNTESTAPLNGNSFTGRCNNSATYTWSGSVSTDWTIAGNWIPARTTPLPTDILVFDGSATPVPGITNLPTQTIGRLLVTGNANVTLQSAGDQTLTISGGTGSDLDIMDGSGLVIGSTGSNRTEINFSPGVHDASVEGSLTLNANSTYSNSFNNTNCNTSVKGSIINNGGNIISLAGNLNFSQGSVYQHNRDGGTIPAATWNTGSDLNISGLASALPAGLGQTFGNVNYSSSYTCALSEPVTINGNLDISAGVIAVQGEIMNLSGNLTGTGGLSLTAGTLNISGDYLNSGTFTSGPAGTLNYKGTNQKVKSTSYGNLVVSGGGTKTLLGPVSVNGTLTLSLGILQLNNSDLTLTNTIPVAGSPFDNSKMIETNGTGHFIRSASDANESFNLIYPVGSGGFYNQLVISNLPVGSPALPRTISVRAVPVNLGLMINSINKYWDISSANISTDAGTLLSFAYNSGEIVGDPLTLKLFTNAFGSWAVATGASSAGSNPATSTGSTAISGLWTAGELGTFYSYQSGPWNLASTWTFDPGGTTGPGTTVPGPENKVVILTERTITLTADVADQNLDITINNGGILDQSGFAFTNASGLKALRGDGILKLASSNFPVAATNSFVATDGGTTEYYHNGPMSAVQQTYFHLNVRSSGTVVQVNNLILNGNLSVKQGKFQINDESTRRLSLVVHGNVNVDIQGSIAVGTGVTNTTASPLGINGTTNGFLNYYDLQSHRIQIYGDFTNNGNVRFTNLDYPVYNSFPPVVNGPTTGFATVYFQGLSDNTLKCSGYTDFYNLVLDKGTDQTFKLTVNPEDYKYFRLFGANTAPGDVTPPATAANPNLKKALWIKNGTLVLNGLTVIPSLSEGSIAGPPTSDFVIPANGAMLLDGEGVIVLSTSDNFNEVKSAYAITEGSDDDFGINNSGGNSGLSVLGRLQINKGYLSTRESSGLLYWSNASGQIIINGGKLDIKQLHNPEGTDQGLVSYIQNGGNVIVRGRFMNSLSYSGPSDLSNPAINSARADNGVDEAAGIGSFSINNNPANGFSMSGGTLTIYDVCNATASPLAFLVNTPVSNINVTGGLVQILSMSGTGLPDANLHVNSTAPFYNLTINRISGSSSVILASNPLVVINDLALTSGILNANSYNVTIGRNCSLASGTTYLCGINTTTFNGETAQTLTIDLSAPLNLNNLTIDKPAGVALDMAGSQQSLNITGELRLVLGTLNDNGKVLNISGNIFNSGIHAGAGKIVLNGTALQTIDGNGVFSNLELNNTNSSSAPVSLAAGMTLNGVLTFSNDKLFDIKTYNLKLNSTASISGANSSRYIKSTGNSGDGGLTKVYNSPVAFNFPVGVANYTPGSIGFDTNPSVYGSITIVPVNYEHPNLTTTGRSLNYFWRVKSNGFNPGSAKVTHGYSYSQTNVITGSGVTEDGYVAARFDLTTNTWTHGTTADVDETNNIIGEPGSGSFLDMVSFIDGDYTAGDDNPVNPFGTPTVYYSRQSGLWSNNNTWSLTGHTGPAAGSVPGGSDIVIIGGADSVYLATNLTVANTDVRSCSSLMIEKGSALDIGYNPASLFEMVVSHHNGNGNFRLTTSYQDGSIYQFPKGDFSDFNVNRGTTEFYSTNPNIGPIFILPPDVNSYGTVILSPAGGSNIALPNTNNVIIYGDLICRGQNWESWLAMSWNGPYGTIIPKTVYVRGSLLLQGGSFVFTFNGSIAQSIVIDGDVIVYPGAGIDLYSSSSNTMSVGGNFINNSDNSGPDIFRGFAGSNVRLRNAGNTCNLVFFGPNPASITNDPLLSPNPNTTLNKVTVNKGSSTATTLVMNIGGTLNTLTDNWLTLQNGRLDYRRTDPSTDFTISTVTPFSISPTAGLYIDYSNASDRDVLIANGNVNSNDLILNGSLTIINGNVYVGPKNSPAYNNDIEYSVGGSSEINVQGGRLVVNGQVRRNPSSSAGQLKYSQTGGTVIVSGQAGNQTNAKFEVVNDGSSFTMSGGTLTIVRGNGTNIAASSPFGDLYLRPGNGSVTGGTIIFSQEPAGTQNYYLDATVPLYNVEITGSVGQPATVRLLTSPLTVNGNTTINSNGILNPDNIDVTFKGNLFNIPGTGGYVCGSNTTTFSAENASVYSGAQSITGETSFYDLVVTPGTSLTLSAPSTVNHDLEIVSGILLLGNNPVSVKGDFINDGTFTDSDAAGNGIFLDGNVKQKISGTGSFARLNLNNPAGARFESSISLLEDLTMTSGILDINMYLLTLGVNSNIKVQGTPFGSSKMITTDGVLSNVGIRKYFNKISDETTFLYPIGTSGKYTPAVLTINSSNSVGYVRINNINSRHPAILDPANALDYYWDVQSSGITGVTGNLVLNYLQGDVLGDEEDYVSARIMVPATTWSLSPGVDIHLNKIPAYYSGSNSLSGEYTAGSVTSFYKDVPVYETVSDGDWSDASIWRQAGGDPHTLGPDGPNGFIVIINNVVSLNRNSCFAYRTTLNNRLEVQSAHSGHNLGIVNGSGTLYLEDGTFPAGVYTSFLNCANNATLEYGGIGTYTTISALFDNIPNLLLTGTGTRVLPNKDLTICSQLVINGPELDNSVYNKGLIILGAMKNLSGAFTSGVGAEATVSFAGPALQTIGGISGNFSGSNAFNNLEINNTSGLRVNDDGAIEVKGNLLLTNGLINTDVNRKLTIVNLANNCVFPYGGSIGSFIDGPLVKRISRYDYFQFPVGKSGTPNMLGNNLMLSSVQAGPSFWSAEYMTPNNTSIYFSPPLKGVSSQEYYRIKANKGYNAILNIGWDPTKDVTPLITDGISNIRLAGYDTTISKWTEIPTAASGNDSYGTATSSVLLASSGSDDYTLGSITKLRPRARFVPSGPVCGTAGIPVSFTSAYPIPLNYIINYTVDGIIQSPVTVTSVPFILPTPVPGVYKLADFTYDIPTDPKSGVVDACEVTVYPVPTTAAAGEDQSFCGTTVATLAGNTPVVGRGEWSIVSGNGGTLVSPSSPISQFYGLNGVSYVLRWTISSGTCKSYDDVTINFNILPDPPVAQSVQTFCGPRTVADLVATAPTGSHVNWYDSAVNGTYLAPGTDLVPGTTSTYYAESDGGAGCKSLTRTAVTFTIYPSPAAGITGGNNYCASATADYKTESGMSDYVWTISAGYISAGQGTNSVTVKWTIPGIQRISVSYKTPEGCIASSTEFDVTVSIIPAVTPGVMPSVCSGSTNAFLTYNGTSGTPDRYSIDFDSAAEAAGFIDVPNTTVLPASPINLYIPAAAQPGVYSGLLRVIISSTGCESEPYPITVTIKSTQVPAISGPYTVCNNSLPNVYTTEAGMNNYIWSVTGGTILSGGGSADNSVTIEWDASGTRRVSVNYTNTVGCTASTPSVINISEYPKPLIVINNPAPVCDHATVNLMAAAVTAGSEPGLTYSYWTDTEALTSYSSPEAATEGTYYIKGITSSGCFDIKPVTVTVNNLSAGSVSGDQTICPGGDPAPFVSDSPGTGDGVITYRWEINTNLSAPSWSIIDGARDEIYDASAVMTTTQYRRVSISTLNSVACESTGNIVTVTVRDLPAITTPGAATSVCFSNSVQTSSLTYTGTTGSPTIYSIAWDAVPANSFAPVTDAILSPDAIAITVPAGTLSGTYAGTLTVRNASNCLSNAVRFTIKVNPLPAAITGPAEVVMGQTVILYNADAGGTWSSENPSVATVNPTGTVTGVLPGTTVINYTLPTGCWVSAPIKVNQPSSFSVVLTAGKEIVCSGESVVFTATPFNAGSAPAYRWYVNGTLRGTSSPSYSYVPLNNDIVAVVLVAGDDSPSRGLETSDTLKMTVNPLPSVTGQQTNVLCSGSATGSINITATAGKAPYTYSWTGSGVNQLSEDQEALKAGSYSVIVTDANSCSSQSLQVIITEPPALSGSIVSQTNVAVHGGNSGSVTVTGSGGAVPYLYKLGNGAYQSSGTFSSLAAGEYKITIQDNNLCTFDIAVTITSPGALYGNITSQSNVACFGGSTGSVTVAGSGGTPPYEYKINNGSYLSSGSFMSLAAGAYTITIRDAAMSIYNLGVTITQPSAALAASIVSKGDVICFGSSTGTVTASGSGGVPPYQYKLGSGSYQASGSFGSQAAGSYALTVKDANLCTSAVNFTITQPSVPFTGSIVSKSNISCFGSSDGTVTVAATGGVLPLMYSINGSSYQASGTFSGLSAGSFTVSIRDADMCATTVPVSLSQPESAIALSYSKTDATCPGESDGMIQLTITGGTQPYRNFWSDGVSTKDRPDIPGGNYTVIVTDMNNCTASVTVSIINQGSETCLEIPQVITPNNDGFNDTWKIKNIDMFPNAEIFIFNRWGKLVFRTRNIPAHEWDGTFEGKLLPTDSYHYILHLNNGSEPRSGVVSIIR
jgi:gliding motility-associated-like protein